MADKASLVRDAQKFLAKGQIDKAITAWETVAGSYPEPNTFNVIGDLYLKKGDKKSGLQHFHKVAQLYLDEGFALKALAIYKKILNIDNRDADALIALGNLNEEKKIATDAIKYFLAASEVLSKDGRRDDLLQIYKKILNLAPSNIQLRAKIAEMYSKEGFVGEAAGEYLEIGRLQSEKGNLDAARDHFMKSMEIVPNNKEALIALSILAEKTGDVSKAVNYTKIAIERIGEDPELLLRNAHLLMETGLLEEAASCISKVIDSDPENMEAKTQLAELHLRTGEKAKAWEGFSPIIDDLLSKDNFKKAAEILNSFKDFQPIESRKNLVSVYKQAGNADLALKELKSLSLLYNENDMQLEYLDCLKEALEIQPDNDELRKKIEVLEVAQTAPTEEPIAEAPVAEAPAVEAPVVEEPIVEAPVVEEPVVEEPIVEAPVAEAPVVEEPVAEAHEKTLEESLTEADIFLKYGLHTDARTLLEGLKSKSPENIEVHLKLKSLYQDINEPEQAVTECIVLSNLYERENDEENKKAYIKAAFEINPDDPRLEGKLEEIGEAPQPVVEEPIAEEPVVEEPIAEEPVVEEPALEEEEILMPDLETIEVQAMQEPDMDDDVLEIFDEFKKGLEQEIESEDTETHYNLGIAYKEMGLIDDAIKAFQTTSNDPNYFVQSMSMLGLCYMEKELFSLAVDSFTGALMKMDPNDEATWSIKYDMADAYERNGSTSEALQFFTEVYGWNAAFREVADKINHLKSTGATIAESAQVEVTPVEAASVDAVPKEKKSRVSYI
jgi:tetratricopeptide (TPR) repeat protein